MKARLIIANSENNADLYYATRIMIPDDFIFIEIDGRSIMYVGELEFSRASEQAQVDEVVNISSCPKKYKNTLSWVIAENGISEILVPGNFPIRYVEILRKLKVKINVKDKEFFEQRAVKREEEMNEIRKVQEVNEEAMRCAIETIRNSRIRGDKKLEYGSRILTSELIKEIIGIEFLRGGCKSQDDIVSCGKDTAQPHKEGSGPLYAEQPILIDIFPRSVKSRYWADMTRTVVKGKAPTEIKNMYDTVLKGQETALANVEAGVSANFLDKTVRDLFKKSGYETEYKGENPQGFIHSLGHGVGLEIHENPFVNPRNEEELQTGNVITIEPGLYYPELGGIRIEDIVLVKEGGCENLTKFPKFLEV